MMHRLFIYSLVLLLSVGPVAQASEMTRDQWLAAFRTKTEWSVQFLYSMLGKAYTDMPLLFSRQVQVDTISLYVLQRELEGYLAKLEAGTPTTRARALRDAYLVKAQADYLSENLARHGALWKKFKDLKAAQCSVATLGEMSKDYSVSAVVQVRAVLDSINKSIDEIAKSPNLENYSFGVTVQFNDGGYSGWTAQGSYGGGGGSSGPGEASVIGVCTGMGAAIGSFFPGPGTIIGAAIGAVVGSIISAFAESPKEKWTRIFREQADLAIDAANTVAAEGIARTVAAACTYYVGNPQLETLFQGVEKEIDQSLKESRAVKTRLDTDYAALRAGYAVQLEKLAAETLPLAKELVSDKFEGYFQATQERSAESRAFARTKLAPSLKPVLQKPVATVDTTESEHTLWDALIEGDALYSGRGGFSFVPAPADERVEAELLHWEPIIQAVLKKLQANPMGATP